MTRSQTISLLNEAGLPGWAESVEHIAGVERILAVLAEPTPEMIEAGEVHTDSLYADTSGFKRAWKAAWAARFGDGG